MGCAACKRRADGDERAQGLRQVRSAARVRADADLHLRRVGDVPHVHRAAAAAAVAEAELKKKEAESKRKARAAAKQKAAEEAEARQFRSELHLSTLLSLVHFTSDSKETIVELFHHSFPHVAKSQILRKIGECSSTKSCFGPRIALFLALLCFQEAKSGSGGQKVDF